MVTTRRIGRRSVRTNSSARKSANREDSSPEQEASVQSPIAPPIDSPDNIHSPYHLTNGDNPGLSIISEVLDGTNYDDWRIAMTIALDAKNKHAFIDGTVSRPAESDPMFRIWSRCNSVVKSWILNFVSKQIYKSILRFNDAFEMWKDLLVRFHITNLPRSYQLSQQIWSLQQGSMDLATYYTTLKTLWNELDGANYVDLCHNCKCCAAVDKKADHARVIKFLAGLNESYAVIRSQIIMKKHIPDLAEIYNLLDQDHSQRSITPVQNAVAFHVNASEPVQASVNATHASSTTAKQNRPICSHCGYTGHTVGKCYRIHGYPPGFKHKTKSTTTPDNSVVLAKPVVAQLALTDTASNEFVAGLTKTLTKDQIQGVIAYFSSQLQNDSDASLIASTSGGTITALPGSYQGVDDWER